MKIRFQILEGMTSTEIRLHYQKNNEKGLTKGVVLKPYQNKNDIKIMKEQLLNQLKEIKNEK